MFAAMSPLRRSAAARFVCAVNAIVNSRRAVAGRPSASQASPALSRSSAAAGRGVTAGGSFASADRDIWLNLLLVELVEPRLGFEAPGILYNYPASQAALARVSGEPSVAERFELYVDGIELANGYHELLDADAGELIDMLTFAPLAGRAQHRHPYRIRLAAGLFGPAAQLRATPTDPGTLPRGRDAPGRGPSRAIPNGDALLAAGTANQTKLVGAPVSGPVYEFAPAIDEYLKTHLFGAMFERDNLDWQSRELATVSMPSALPGA